MIRILIALAVSFLVVSCSSVKVKTQNGFVVHEDLYRLPILKDETWMRVIPVENVDAIYLRCPGNQGILIDYVMLCRKFDYAKLTPDDYVKRIYLNSYFSAWEKTLCPEPVSPLTDKNFKNLVGSPIVNADDKSFSIVYETDSASLCKTTEKLIPMKVKDVFLEEPKSHFAGGMHTRFVVLRYASAVERFDDGLKDFENLVSKFQWLEEKEQ